MASKKVSLVSYRRNSSDMDLSSSDEDTDAVGKIDRPKHSGISAEKDSFIDKGRNGDKRGSYRDDVGEKHVSLREERLHERETRDPKSLGDKRGCRNDVGKHEGRFHERESRDSKSLGDKRGSYRDDVEKYEVIPEERLHERGSRDSKIIDDRRDDSRKDRRSPEKSKKDRRRSDSERRREDCESKRSYRGKERSVTPDRRKRKSRDRSRGRSPTHHHHRQRSRSPGRSKYSPDRRDQRKRSHSPDRRPHKSRRGSRSPESSFRSKRLEKKAARIDRLGLELVAEPKWGVRPFHEAYAKDGEQSSGGVVPSFFNPGATNPARIAEQIQKRRLLWGGNKKEPAAEQPSEQPGTSGTGKTWEAATFKGDNDGKMTEKFKRLMGIKGEHCASGTTADSGESIIQKQEEMFSNMEAQYQVARMATHTHRGIGLGFGTFQVPPR